MVESTQLQAQVQAVAERTTALDHFLGEEERLLKEWADRSNQLFR